MGFKFVNPQDKRHAQLPEPLRAAVLAHEAGQHETAYPLYRQFVTENPKHPLALQLFGLLLSQLGQYEPAIALMRESLTQFPEQAEVANNLGNALLKAERLDEAIASYGDAVRIQPSYADAWRNLGLAYAKADRHDDAIESFRRCIELRPTDAVAWFSLGNAHRDQGDLDAAITDFEKAIELQPGYAAAHHNLGVCLRLRHEPERALEHYEKARDLGLDGPQMRHNLGNAYMDLQRPEPAIQAYRAALAQDPLNLDTHHNLNAVLWQHEYLDDYLKSYRDVLAANPAHEPLRLAYATALTRQDRHAEAEEILRDGIRRSGASSALKSLLAHTFEGQGRWEEALRMHAGAVETPGAVPNHQISYGRALLACQRPDEALVQLRAAAGQMPFNQRALAYLGLCWRLLGDERDHVLNDYENLVRAYEVPIPAGYRNAAEFGERLKSVLEPLHITKQHPAEQTLRGGTQTSGNIFDRRDPEIAALIDGLEQCIGDYIGRFPRIEEHPLFSRRRDTFAFSASWSVRLERGGYHTMHTHPLGWISSAFYVDVPPEIVETDAHGGGIQFGKPDIDIGPAGDAQRRIQPTAGKLVLFPSYMWHGTVPFESDAPRMTIAFDVVPGA